MKVSGLSTGSGRPPLARERFRERSAGNFPANSADLCAAPLAVARPGAVYRESSRNGSSEGDLAQFVGGQNRLVALCEYRTGTKILDRLLVPGHPSAESQDEPEPMPERFAESGLLANWRRCPGPTHSSKASCHAAFLALLVPARPLALRRALLMSASVVCVRHVRSGRPTMKSTVSASRPAKRYQ
jgi:hypothetical protein